MAWFLVIAGVIVLSICLKSGYVGIHGGSVSRVRVPCLYWAVITMLVGIIGVGLLGLFGVFPM